MSAVTQHQKTATVFSAKCIPQCSLLLCKTGLQQACITAITPVKICSLYRCAVTHHQGTATLFRAKCSPHCSLLLCKTGLQQACITAITPVKICSSYRCAVTHDQRHCNAVFCKMQSPLITAALQDRLAAGLYHCKYTYEDLLFIQVCSDPTPEHSNTVQGKMQSPLLTAALQDTSMAVDQLPACPSFSSCSVGLLIVLGRSAAMLDYTSELSCYGELCQSVLQSTPE